MSRSFEFTSHLRSDAATVWAHARTMAGVNYELWPLCRMTFPAAYASRTLEDAPTGQRAFRSWILLFGILPIDYDDITLIQINPDRGFVENSTMLTQRVWRHKRIIEPQESGCTISDHVSYEPRLSILSALFHPMFRITFWNRHRRLRKKFGSA